MPKNPYKSLDVTKEQFLELLEKYNGNLYRVYTELELPYNRFAQWREEDEEFAAAIDKIKNKTKQWVEDKMFEFIAGTKGDAQSQGRMIQFYLRSHGYNEKKEIVLDSKSVVDVNTAIDSIRNELENEPDK